MTILTSILIILVLVFLSGVLATAQMAILMARRGRLEQQASTADRAAQIAMELADNPRHFLPAVQAPTILLQTLTAVLAGAFFVGPLSDWLRGTSQPMLVDRCQSIALLLVALGMAAVAMVFGQRLPRRLALAGAEQIARRAAWPMRMLQHTASPAVWLIDRATSALCFLFRVPHRAESTVSIEEIEHLIHTGTRKSLLEPAEQMVARRALRLSEMTVREIMRPRIDIDALDVDTPPAEVIGAVAMAGFSRLPIHEGDLDHIIGFVYTKDLLLRQHMGWPIELRKLVRPALLVPESLRIDKLLERFREKRTQMALVLDEFGGTEGLVTMEDVLEELVGEIHDEHRTERQPEIIACDKSSWIVDAGFHLRELLERLGRGPRHPAPPQDVNTVGGLVLSLLGRIPAVGDTAAWDDFNFEVLSMDGRRLERILVSKRRR